MIEEGEMDEKYKMVTVSFDATHRLSNRKPQSQELWSYKLKDFAYNIMVRILPLILLIIIIINC